ncbi:MAG: 4Fe-4S dicluster domain-containing protein [Acidobacteriota bacterium]|nr:4Fe-4S dicluster domain-containing protein [Acidobacteriota bacterium]
MSKTFVIDLDRCIGCQGCHVACKQENGVSLGLYWNRVLTMGPNGRFPKVEMYFLPVMCQECSNPPCVQVCPTGASQQMPDGIVLIDKAKCIGCELCVKACPYGSRTLNPETKVVEKCTTCVQLRESGSDPACVINCPGRCRFFGDTSDPNSTVSVAIKKAGAENVHSLPDSGNHPSVKYILHPKNGVWRKP